MFYDNYVKLCKSVGKTPSAVAIEIGIGKSNVTYWKTGRNKPTDLTLAKLADYFGVSVSYLKGEEEQKENPQIRQDQEVSESFKELLGMMKDAPEDDLRLLIKMYQAIRSERDNG